MATMTRLSLTLNPKSGGGPSREHFWQVWLKSVQRFQRRRFKCEKLTDGRTTTHDKSSHDPWPGGLDFQRYRAENVFGSLIPMRLERRSFQPTTCLNPRNFFLPRCLKCTLPFKPISYHIFDLLLVVVFFIMWFIVVSITSRSVNLKENWSKDMIGLNGRVHFKHRGRKKFLGLRQVAGW
jgi:hypothetical protein